MKGTIIAILVLPLLLCGCQSNSSGPVAIQKTNGPARSIEPAGSSHMVVASDLQGTWKVDPDRTTFPNKDDKEREEEISTRIELRADGKYAITGVDKPESGTWLLTGNQVFLEDDRHQEGPVTVEVSPDGSSLTKTKDEDGHTYKMVLVKA